MEKKKNVPVLRFPEFSGDWEQKKLGEVFTNIVRPIPKPNENYLAIGIRSHFKGTFQKIDSDPSKIDMETLFIVKENDLIVNITFAWEGAVAIANLSDDNGLVSHRFPSYVCVSNQLAINFFRFQYPTKEFKYELDLISPGGAGRNRVLKKNDFLKIKFKFPKLQEQNKISSFLTVVDDKFQSLKKKKNLLEQYKKGMMQKIFSQELQFKDDKGIEYPKWLKKKLGQVCKIYDGTHQTPDYKDEGIPFYSVEHVTSNNFLQTKYISIDVYQKENEKVKLEKGDILMTKIGDIGTAKYINWDVEASYYVSLALIKKSMSNNHEFICHFINSSFFQSELHQRTIHVAFPKKINLGEIGECLIKLPCLEEQTKIANFLTAIDDKINLCNTQIEKTEQWKKGLLQKMFV